MTITEPVAEARAQLSRLVEEAASTHERFEISEWLRVRVNLDYHVAFDGNFYSVPYNLVHEVVEIRSTATTTCRS